MIRLLVCCSTPPPRSFSVSGVVTSSRSSDDLNFGLRCSPIVRTISTSLLSLAVTLGISWTCASDAISLQLIKPQEEVICREEENYAEEKLPEEVTNEEIVEEAWQLVNDAYLDTGRRHWSADSWLKRKEDISASSIPTRSRAHEIIRRMLASLGDPYTRFLTPAEFSKMARYDMTGIGINLREIPDDNGETKLKIFGLILDGPAHSAGVKQGDELLSINGVDIKGKSSFEASSMLQGPSETFVNIMVKHGKCGPVESIKVQRQSIAKTPVFYQLRQANYGSGPLGYIRLKEFNALARKDLVIAMRKLQDMGASIFILDLRDNLGGLVQAGIEIAKLFLNKGNTVGNIHGRQGSTCSYQYCC